MIVYTAIFDGYDRTPKAPYANDRTPHVLFTDRRAREPGWDVRVVKRAHANPARENRYYKLQPHEHLPDGARVLYHDGRISLTLDPREILRLFQVHANGDHDVFTLTHTLGHKAYDEPTWVLGKRITDPNVIREQVQRYEDAGVPRGLPTCQAALHITRINDRTRAFFDAWWGEVARYSHRDQVSFPYAWWTTNADVKLIPFKLARAFFTMKPHRKPQLEGAK